MCNQPCVLTKTAFIIVFYDSLIYLKEFDKKTRVLIKYN